MRELVLNHASIAAPDVPTAVDIMRDLANGMATLIDARCASPVLRAKSELYNIRVNEHASLYDVLIAMRKQNAIDEFRFIGGLTTKSPLLADLPDSVVDKFRGCESADLPAEDGEPLVLCAHTKAVSVSFPVSEVWDRDQLSVRFSEMLSDETITEVGEVIDNLARSVHATAISNRHRTQLRADIQNPSAIWMLRNLAFPALLFGLDVEDQLKGFQVGFTQTLVGRLAELNESAGGWKRAGGPAPAWTCKVTPESTSVENNPVLREARRFRNSSGVRELFLWHARFGSACRIHIRLLAASREVEVGYVGTHLPLS